MSPLPFSELPATIAFVVAVAVFVVFQVIASGSSLRSKETSEVERTDRGSLFVVVITSGVGVALAAVLATKVLGATVATGSETARYLVFSVGILAILAGSALRQWAVATLGSSFTFDVRVARDQRIISSGPYRWLRHPSYSGLLLALVGLGLALGNWLSIAVLVVLPTAGIVWRISVEEDALRRSLGDEYEDFATSRKRLIPKVW
jgi:protein-S-isoprenylcysteine O-methyltransferase Ste14